MGMTGIPIINVNNNCSTGSAALYLAHNQVKACQADCVMALGFEKMFTGSLKSFFEDRAKPLDLFYKLDDELRGASKGP